MITLAERRRVERFAAVVDNPDDLDSAEFSALQTLTRTLQRVPINGDIDPEFRAKLRTRVIAMSSVRLPTQRDATETTTKRPAEPPRHGRLHRRLVVLGGVSACVLSVSAVGAASMNSVAGDPLYGLKKATESAQVAVAGNDTDRGRRYLTHARTRLGEVPRVRGDERALLETLTAMDQATRQGTRLLTGVAANEQDRAPLDSLDKFAADQRATLGKLLPTLPAGKSRDRAAESLLLIEQLRARSIALRATVACPAAAAPADNLGPQPVSCGAGDVPATGSGTGLGGSATGSALPGAGTELQSPAAPSPAAGTAGPVGGIVKDVLGGSTSPAPAPAPAPSPAPVVLPLPLPLPSIIPALPLLPGS